MLWVQIEIKKVTVYQGQCAGYFGIMYECLALTMSLLRRKLNLRLVRKQRSFHWLALTFVHARFY